MARAITCFVVVAAVTSLGPTARADDASSAPRPHHTLASSWRTVVIHATKPAWPDAQVAYATPDQRQPLVPASLTPAPPSAKPLIGSGHQLSGIASYYWQDQMTASGERFDKRALTAAHRTLPIGTRVRVTHVSSGRTVVVRINDRGPFKPGRVIDLSEAAAEVLSMTSAGLAQVQLDVVP
jgi:rare lipoprotein A (peptidoglycan hydrolase)